MILELVRVCKPGGQVLIAAVPDSRKRWRARFEVFKVATLRERAQILGALVLPLSVKRLVRRVAPSLPRTPLVYLEYDLLALSL